MAKHYKLESDFKKDLAKEIETRFPGAMVLHLDPNEVQGIPDLIVLHKNRYAMLEGKIDANATHRPNQDYYVEKFDKMSFARFIYPENKEEVLDELSRTLDLAR